MVPLTINCWPSISGNESYVNIEYECQTDFDLQNIVVAIPCHQSPKINQVSASRIANAGTSGQYGPISRALSVPACSVLTTQ